MSSSAGLLTPRGPFSGAAPLALRPLSAIAASTAGGVPETRIKRLLSDLLPSLMALHAQGEICGDISLDTVGMDESARAHLVPELVVARSRRATRTPTPGFAPFELYSDSVEWPRGPWSDIYALCAVMHALVIGSKPAPAPERRAEDTYEPLASLGLPKYSQDFLSAIDAGLAMAPADRPQTLADLAGMLGIAAQVETAPDLIAPLPASHAAPPAAAAAAHQPARGRHPLLVLLLVVALIGAGVYAWFESGMGAPNALITRSEVVQPNPPAVHPMPPPAPGAGPVAPPSPPELRTPQESAPQTPAPESAPALGETPPPSAPPAEAPAAVAVPSTAVPAEAPAAVAEETAKPKPIPVLVRLDIRPWGEVWINGVARGISPPVKELRLIPGKYQVVLRNAGLPPYRTTLEVKAGKPAVISHVFQ
ncbi:serine/threonine protein kinase domain protein [Achromobacter xylosoxidans A8]|uniref:Serine/threonine protein kinase domain protein n=1 Tax=Achromobacter xylosoxidans (strain A8) TaxID=762376 RepID=E3HT16_ACHXA|nr:serine/threonine protein kinase [Achromobacter xylosoxidans]ADP19760.1 serine/threonine protein kinase domain protein [Achromobacter xylosoxidans A8]